MKRPHFLKEIALHFKAHPAVAILGPRQVGKTTLAKMYIAEHSNEEVHFFDLENPLDLARLENPMLTFSKLTSCLIVIDEVQRRPELFGVLRVLIDENQRRKFLILGSASRELLRQSSETLAGRIGYIELPPFSLEEAHDASRLFLRGGFPRSYLAEDEKTSFLWRNSYITSFLERDIAMLGFQIPPEQMRRFWLMLLHYHGQIFNAADLGRSMGVSDHTIRRYLDILAGTFMVRILYPWFENLSKRQVKSPKIYFRDSGILNTLLGIQTEKELHLHPKIGAFWEGFALEEIILEYGATANECFFWATQAGAELDLLLIKDGKRIGFEFKYSDHPKLTSSMNIALNDLKLDHLYLIYPGNTTFPLADRITVRGLRKSLY